MPGFVTLLQTASVPESGGCRWPLLELSALRRPGLTLVAALPPVAFFALIWVFGSDVVFWDEWNLLDIIVRTKHGTATAADYLRFHTVHRMVFSNFVLSRLALLTGWNVRIELLLNVAIATITYALVVFNARRTTSASTAAIVAVSGLTIFSLSQHENWLWGWQISWFFTVATAVAAVTVLAARELRFGWRLLIAALLCFAATFSIAFGAVTWVALLGLVWIEAKRPFGASALWVAAGATAIALYVRGEGFWIQPAADRAQASVGHLLLFFVAVQGRTFTSLAIPSVLLGSIVIAIFVAAAVAAIRIDRARAMPWIALGLFSLGFGVLSAAGRARIGWETAVSSRYATPAVLLGAATCFLVTIALERDRRFAPVRAGLLIALVAANLTFVPVFVSHASARYVDRVCTDLAFLGIAGCDGASASPLADGRRRLERARDEELRAFADASWFPARSGNGNVAASRRASTIRLSGDAGFSILPRAVLLTQGAGHSPLALVWARTGGAWKATIEANELRSDEGIDAWTIEGHARHFTHLGSARVE